MIFLSLLTFKPFDGTCSSLVMLPLHLQGSVPWVGDFDNGLQGYASCSNGCHLICFALHCLQLSIKKSPFMLPIKPNRSFHFDWDTEMLTTNSNLTCYIAIFDATCTWSGHLPVKVYKNPTYSW